MGSGAGGAKVVILVGLMGCCPQSSVPVGVIDTPEAAFGVAYDALSECCRSVPILLVEKTGRGPARFREAGGFSAIEYDRWQVSGHMASGGFSVGVGIFAHEIGHQIDELDRRDLGEESADAWAGCALRVAGLDSGPFVTWVRHNTDRDGQAVIDGWRLCGG